MSKGTDGERESKESVQSTCRDDDDDDDDGRNSWFLFLMLTIYVYISYIFMAMKDIFQRSFPTVLTVPFGYKKKKFKIEVLRNPFPLIGVRSV